MTKIRNESGGILIDLPETKGLWGNTMNNCLPPNQKILVRWTNSRKHTKYKTNLRTNRKPRETCNKQKTIGSNQKSKSFNKEKSRPDDFTDESTKSLKKNLHNPS